MGVEMSGGGVGGGGGMGEKVNDVLYGRITVLA